MRDTGAYKSKSAQTPKVSSHFLFKNWLKAKGAVKGIMLQMAGNTERRDKGQRYFLNPACVVKVNS